MSKNLPDNTEEVNKNIRRILTCDINELSGTDLELREGHERGKKEYEKRQEIEKNNFKGGDLREHLFDFGYAIETNEMKRDFYLKNRVNKVERKNMLEIFEIMRDSAIKDKLAFGCAVLGVGTSTYSDKYFSNLEKYLLENNFTRNDFISEEAKSYWKEAEDFDTYEDYVKYCFDYSPAFDEKITPSSKETFLYWKSRDQKSYSKKKKIGEILDKKGEDLDFIVCHDYHSDISEYDIKKMKEFKENFLDICKEKGFDLFKESSYLNGSDYWYDGKKLVRWKEIGNIDRGRTYRISFDKGRNFHFYFRDVHANSKVRKEKIENYSFVQLIRKGNYRDFKDTVLHGEKTGIFENPFYARKK